VLVLSAAGLLHKQDVFCSRQLLMISDLSGVLCNDVATEQTFGFLN
jgi:hypothetical protein